MVREVFLLLEGKNKEYEEKLLSPGLPPEFGIFWTCHNTHYPSILTGHLPSPPKLFLLRSSLQTLFLHILHTSLWINRDNVHTIFMDFCTLHTSLWVYKDTVHCILYISIIPFLFFFIHPLYVLVLDYIIQYWLNYLLQQQNRKYELPITQQNYAKLLITSLFYGQHNFIQYIK